MNPGGPVVYPWVTHRNPCPMNLYFLNWVKYAWCYNISIQQGLKVSISQVIDLCSQTTKFFMNFPLQWTQKVAVFKHSYLWFYLTDFEKIGIFGIRKRSSTSKSNFIKILRGWVAFLKFSGSAGVKWSAFVCICLVTFMTLKLGKPFSLVYSVSSIVWPCWATFFQNLGRIRKVSIVGCPPYTTYTTLKRT